MHFYVIILSKEKEKKQKNLDKTGSVCYTIFDR